MPRAEERKVPKGQAYGVAGQQEAFLAAAPTAAAAQPPAEAVKPLPPLAAGQDAGKLSLPAPEAPAQNVHAGLDLNSILFGGTQRPGEAVTAGLPGAPKARPVAELLEQVVMQGGASRDVLALAAKARELGL